MSTSVIIIVKNRHEHLKNVLWGLQQNKQKFEVVVVHMNEPTTPKPEWFDNAYKAETVTSNSPLPLAVARNKGAALATGELLVFLDVDCIPYHSLLQDYIDASNNNPNALLMGEVYYLPEHFKLKFADKAGKPIWRETDLKDYGVAHLAREYLQDKTLRQENNYHRFWSLNFALPRKVFLEQVKGFTEAFEGYGAEDTDFSKKAEQQQIPLYWVSGATAFHQYHTTYCPPLHHFDDIIKNCTLFKERWGYWPMGWQLGHFVKGGYIDWSEQAENIKVLKQPSNEDMENARTEGAFD